MSRDIAVRAEEDPVAAGASPSEPALEPCPEGTEELIDWLRDQFPEISPRTSDPRVVDACLARAGCIDLINYIEAALEAARKEQHDNA